MPPRPRTPIIARAATLAIALIGAHASAGEPEPTYEFTVTERLPVTASSTLSVPAEDLELRPLESGGQLIEAVPNAVTAQHTGGGKAEQYFLRGFDADHGTDLAAYFDGVPVNLRSHAHGQGFMDLHFVIPETIQRIDAYKGPYFAQFGDFATAAAVEYVPYGSVPESFVRFDAGEFDTYRGVGMVSPRVGPFATGGPADGLLAFEAYHTNGPFENPENLQRYSLFGTAGLDLGAGLRLSGHALGYGANWDASGLIPRREVDAGALSRFGSVDPTEGGRTRRAQGKLQLDWSPDASTHLLALAYLSWYDFQLFSNFTYFLNDPVHGDGIVQTDQDRLYSGGRIELSHLFDGRVPGRLRGGAEVRYDDTRVVLGTQTRRSPTGTTTDDRIRELSVEPYLEMDVEPSEWSRLVVGLRFAWFRFTGTDLATYGPWPTVDSTRWLPKANLALRPFGAGSPLASGWPVLRETELFFNFGIGYHSNDARAAFSDPAANVLPRATGGEIGLRARPFQQLEVAVDWWILSLEDEFVFVGDEGTTESAGATLRQGVELVARWWLLDWLYLRGDVAYTDARLIATGRPVPQAPRFVAKAELGARWRGLHAYLGVRSLGSRYASDAFYEPKLSGYTVWDLGASYRWRFLEVALLVENLTNTAWRSSEFFYSSCLASEVGVAGGCPAAGGGVGVSDFHFTPGNPRNVRGRVTVYF